ncbi:MAG TPA: pyridoxamine 5'-phosphate oxidase family protein, partial [Pseudonocardia sp.]|nr:pyridoxamine 5'-phosphate oxidase family protein [Pseudonocardia sp.]
MSLSPTRRSTPTRLRERASTDRADLYAVLDEGLVCHVGV